MTRSRLLSLLLVLCATLVAACGSHSVTPPVKPATAPCSVGRSFPGCAVPHSGLRALPATAAPSGGYFPDVSNWQGHPNWAAAKPHIVGAAVKAGEYREDIDFAWNIGQLKALHIPWVPYWFVRNTGCSHEGAEIVSVIKSVGGLTSGPVVLDMEVPEARGYAPCLDSAVFAAFHRHAIIYTAPGTWPGGSNAGLPVWEATYGSSFSAVWHPVVAWQFTDGVFGSRVFIPGIGFSDVSVDFSLFKLPPAPKPAPKPKPVDPYAIYLNAKFPSRWGPLNERLTVEQYDGALKHAAKYRIYIQHILQPKIHFLADRIAYVALTEHKGWSGSKRGSRFQLIIHRAEQKIG